MITNRYGTSVIQPSLHRTKPSQCSCYLFFAKTSRKTGSGLMLTVGISPQDYFDLFYLISSNELTIFGLYSKHFVSRMAIRQKPLLFQQNPEKNLVACIPFGILPSLRGCQETSNGSVMFCNGMVNYVRHLHIISFHVSCFSVVV